MLSGIEICVSDNNDRGAFQVFPNYFTYPVAANRAKACMIFKLSSRSLELNCNDMFRGWPNTYSISSPCITPIHSPHKEVLVLCKDA